MASKERMNINDSPISRSNLKPPKVVVVNNGSAYNLSPVRPGGYYILVKDDAEKTPSNSGLRKPLSSSSTNKLMCSNKKPSISDETVRAAEEILAVLQDSPVKNKNVETISQNKSNLNHSNRVNNKAVIKKDSNDKKNDKTNHAYVKLNDNDIVEMIFDSDDSLDDDNIKRKPNILKTNSLTKKINTNVASSSDKCTVSEVSAKNSCTIKSKKVLDDEDIFFVSTDSEDSDDSDDENRKDKIGVWTVKKSPSCKSPKLNGNPCKSPKLNGSLAKGSNNFIVENKVRRSLASQLVSPKENKSIATPLRLKLKRKAPIASEDEPAFKERKVESKEVSCANQMHFEHGLFVIDAGQILDNEQTVQNSSAEKETSSPRGLRCRSTIKLPKWRVDENTTSATSVPPTVKKTSNSSNVTIKIKSIINFEKSPSHDKIKKDTRNTPKKSSSEALKSAEEIYELLSTPEKNTAAKNRPSGSRLSAAKSSPKKLQDSFNTLNKGGALNHEDKKNLCGTLSETKTILDVETSPARKSSRIKNTIAIKSNLSDSPSRTSTTRNQKSLDNGMKFSPTAIVKIKHINSPCSTPKNNRACKTGSDSNSKKLTEKKNSFSGNKNDSITSKELFSDKSEKSICRHSIKEASSRSLEEARTQLLASTIPQSLPCRDKEFNNIYSFIFRKIEDLAGGCMYISGVPGTGKTATVNAVIKKLQIEAKQGEVQEFEFVEINGLRLTEPRQAYTCIWKSLSGQRLTPEQAQRSLDRKFSTNAKKPTVLLVDELDYLCNRRQDVVYSILDWPTKQGSALVILTIANTMDLPERTLKGKVTSRMGLTRLVFQPYTHHQLQEIVLNRLSGNNSFHPDAVQLVARKVAAVSGDARRALDICRRAAEMVDASSVVNIKNVEQALNQIFTGPRIRAIKSCCVMAQLVLRALRDETLGTGVEESNISKVYRHLTNICTLEGVEKPTTGDVLSIATALENLGLIVAEKGRPDIMRKLTLNVSSDDIHYALNC